ncbi:MAG TPA: DUF5671 domain-containing protein [Actinomycetota bacterium]|nr:DUF5671 domain-containing protein [Actinomycetota bacterium]
MDSLRVVGFLVMLVPLAILGAVVAAVVVAVRRRSRAESWDLAPKQIFLHLLAMATLYISAAGVLILLWALAEQWFPDPYLTFDYGGDSDAVRGGISMAVVAFPIFLVLAVQIRRKTANGEIPAASALRAGFVYANLFVVAVAVLITLMVSVNAFLDGDLTPRFAVRAGGVLLLVGLLYLYYRSELEAGSVVGPSQTEVSP